MTALLRVVAGALLTALLAAATAQAQTEPIKLGKIDPADLTAAPFLKDSAAAAVVLYDYGTTRFVYSAQGWQLQSDRTTRLKILKKAGYEVATVEVPLYHKGENSEKIGTLRGFTFQAR